MSIVCSIVILYAKYLAKMLRTVRHWNKKVPRPDKATMFRPGTVPVPVPVLSLVVAKLMTLNGIMTVILRFFTEFGRFGSNNATVIQVRPNTVCDTDVGHRI